MGLTHAAPTQGVSNNRTLPLLRGDSACLVNCFNIIILTGIEIPSKARRKGSTHC